MTHFGSADMPEVTNSDRAAGKALLRRPWVSGATLYLAFLCLYMVTASGQIGGDRYFRYLAAEGIVERGWPALPEDTSNSVMAVIGKDGRPYSFYGVGQTLLFVPFILVSKLIKMYPRYDLIGEWFITTLNCFVGAALVVAIWWLAQSLSYDRRVALSVALVAGLATPVWVEATGGGDYLLEAMLITVCLAALFHALTHGSKVAWMLAGFAYGYAIATRLSSLFALPGIAFIMICGVRELNLERRRVFGGLLFSLGALPGIALFLGYNVLRFGYPLVFGYESKPPYWFEQPIWQGLAALLFGPVMGQGLIWNVPVILAIPFAVRKIFRRAVGFSLSIAIMSASYLLLYAQFSSLGKGLLQYLTPLVPFIALFYSEIFAGWRRIPVVLRLIISALILLSAGVEILGFGLYWNWLFDNAYWRPAIALMVVGGLAFASHVWLSRQPATPSELNQGDVALS